MCLRRQPIETVASYPERVAASLPYIYALCRRSSRFQVVGVDADDVVMEAVVQLLKDEHRYTDRHQPGRTWNSWLRIKTWTVVFRLRQTKGWCEHRAHRAALRPDQPTPTKVVVPLAADDDELRGVPDRATADDEPRMPACRRRVRRAVRRLPRAERRAVLAVYWLGWAVTDVDRANGLGVGATAVRTYRGRNRLRKLLADGVQS